MNNNCTKCGNPLQVGTTICPICGTNNINASVAPNTPVAPATPDSPAPAPAPAPVTPAPAVDLAQPVAPAAEPSPAPASTPAAQAAPVTPVAPTPAAKKEKKPVNKKLFIIVGIIAAIIIIGAVVAMIVINNSSKVEEPIVNNSTNNNNNNNNKTASSSTMSLNGFTFMLPNGWSVDTTGGNTAIVDKNASTIIQLLSETGSISNINTESMKDYFVGKGFENVNLEEKQIGGKKGIVVNTTSSSDTYQYDFYYIETTEGIIGSGVVYTDSATKSKNTAIVEQIMNSLAYSPTANMASELNMYDDVIANYGAALEGGSSINPDNSTTPDLVDPNGDETQTNPDESSGGRF